MRVGMISSFTPVECGVATYTQFLVEGLRNLRNEVYIVCHVGGEGYRVYPVFDAEDYGLADKAYETMIKFTPDLVHIQHEFGLYGRQRGVNIIPLIYKFKLAAIPVVATLHTVLSDMDREEKIILKAIIDAADGIIVHEEYQKEIIDREFGRFEKIYVIPHGIRMVKLVPRAKEKIGVNGKKVALLCGYFRPTKGFDRIVRLFPQVASQVEDSLLVVAGKARRQEFTDYRDRFFTLINDSPAHGQIKVLRGQFPQPTFDTILSAADVVPMPYITGGQSGIMAHCLAFGRPTVVSDNVQALVDIVEKAKSGFVARTDDEFVELMVRILKDTKLKSRLSANARSYVAENLSWNIVAKRHTDAYHKVVQVPYGDAQYIYI